MLERKATIIVSSTAMNDDDDVASDTFNTTGVRCFNFHLSCVIHT